MRSVWIVIVIGGFVSATQGCSPVVEATEFDALRDKIGERCEIQFRRDALGTASKNPVSPLTDRMNGGQTSISGTLIAASEDWIVINSFEDREFWIPPSNVLLLEFSASNNVE